MKVQPSDQYEAVNRAFTKQASHYDADDNGNPVLQSWRRKVYAHLDQFLKPGSSILELNAGTGIDAAYLAQLGHCVHATDLSDGMIEQIKVKASDVDLHGRLTYQQLSFEDLDQLKKKKFDHIFSNFGGLNCAKDLRKVFTHFRELLRTGGYVTVVIMPPVCPWEILSILKGNRKAFRRMGGIASSHLEGEYFQAYYYSLSKVRLCMGPYFKLKKVEGLGVLSPPTSRSDFPLKHPTFYKFLNNLDSEISYRFPFNRLGDHLIITFQHFGAD